ncbi:MAG TPA: alginate lyase family protein [Xanthobacteraceae bacterium]
MIREVWRLRRGGGISVAHLPGSRPSFTGMWHPPAGETLPREAVHRLVSTAEALLKGRWKVFAHEHSDFGQKPDWFIDASSGRRAPSRRYAFDIPYRNEAEIGDIKYIWEPSRHHHLTVLAAAYAVTGDERYATRVRDHLRSWWVENPFLSGPHWISGIELGIRLISWVWTRRLLNGWSEAPALFERNPEFIHQLYHHQIWLSAFPSHGSSANNHLVAEAAGQFTAAAAFPCFAQSRQWRRRSAEILRHAITAQTFPSGLNRELATDYHGLVLELFLAAAIEGQLTGHPLEAAVWERIRAMVDALAAVVDSARTPPRQGDGDEGVGLLLDAPEYRRWDSLLATGTRLFRALPWWPRVAESDIRTPFWTHGVRLPPLPESRLAARPDSLPDAGHLYLRCGRAADELWCRYDAGPHGFLKIAAHAHADALSIEVRVGGVELLADPGTYSYYADPEWRSYFRATRGHNTLELMGQNQSASGGPFMWMQHAQSRLVAAVCVDENANESRLEAEHTGYVSRGGPIHRRSVLLNRCERTLTVCDTIVAPRHLSIPAGLYFHLGPEIDCQLERDRAELRWPNGSAVLELPSSLLWTLHRGEIKPVIGWYSPRFGIKVPAFTLAGKGIATTHNSLTTRLSVCRHVECSLKAQTEQPEWQNG